MKLRLLLIEDSLDDEVLILRQLDKAGFDIEFLRIDSIGGLTYALREPWDVVLSDYHLPELDVRDVFAQLRAKAPDTPVIIISGAASEETIVDALKLGAHNYVMKSNLTRLPETVRRELQDAEARRERRALEEQLRQSQKLEAVGQLACSVAHDFNNLLTAIISFAQFAHDDLDESNKVRSDLLEVIECSNRAAVLTRQLLAFGRRSVVEPRLTDLNVELQQCQKTLTRLLGPTIEYETLPTKGPAAVVVDRALFEQVLGNLVINARDAMPGGGKLTVETAIVEKHPELSGPHVLFAITDTGVGMTDEVQRRIFEPFFTTKGPGHGTGLGLSTVAAIVKQCNGHLSVYSAVGRGTTFKVYLPCAPKTATPTAEAAAKVELAGAETVLVVEDQEPVRSAVSRALTSRGYRVVEVGTARAALELVHAQQVPVDLVLTDFVLPQMSGEELVTRLKSSRPELKVVMMSGYGAGALSPPGVGEAGMPFLQKPFTPDVLLQKVRVALDT
ncbi:MAG: response regulator [Myxococcaceae bacterium]|nr:response regulator [Myxococcaceae bacterium]